MIAKQLIDPKSIVVVGGSDDIHKPGGTVLRNLQDGNFKGSLYVVNRRWTWCKELSLTGM